MKMEMNTPYIVCAANIMPDGTMFIGARHWDELMSQQADNYLKANDKPDHFVAVAEQGFIDQWGTFYDRGDAWLIAERNGQIRKTGPGFSGPDLYSENLY